MKLLVRLWLSLKLICIQGTYRVFGFTVQFDDAFVMVQNGQYAVELTIEKKGKILFLYRVYANVIKM